MVSRCRRTFVGSVSHGRRGNSWSISVLHHPAAHQEHGEATCLSGIHPKRCSVSSKQKVPKSNLRFYSKLSMMMMSWRCGTSHHPFLLNTLTNVVACNGQCTLLTTLFLAIKNVGGLSANQNKS